ncbi:MAG: peptidoglycan editing factor PgeF [Alphaproteobacteria bacterium]|nr:peptidoglycan editing factor PgeF [Alphaproteobacteria bacterium]
MLTSPRLAAEGLAHGFFTRTGGVSEGAFASRNCGFSSSDTPARVRENRARSMAALGLPADALMTLRQVHSPTVVTVRGAWADGVAPAADGLVTDRPGLVLGILTADCAPVLLADAEAGVIGAAHAGWRGALDGVIEATVAAMAALGARPSRIAAAVGPCIAQASYEVGPEFRARFTAIEAQDLFQPGTGDRYQFDLPGFARRRLEAAGVGQIEVLGRDTCADAEMFFSYRRSVLTKVGAYGSNLSAIARKP